MMNILKRSFLFLSPAVQSPRIPSPSFTQYSGHYHGRPGDALKRTQYVAANLI